VRSVGKYIGAYMDLIHAYKYYGKVQLARPFGRLLFHAFIRHYDISHIDYIIPIPLHISRLKQRGFNQSLLMLQEWPKLIKELNGSQTIPDLKKGALIRTKNTKSQIGLNKKQRKKNIKNSFKIVYPSILSGKKILLIDDVYTTGATAEECGEVLSTIRAKEVNVLTLARAT